MCCIHVCVCSVLRSVNTCVGPSESSPDCSDSCNLHTSPGNCSHQVTVQHLVVFSTLLFRLQVKCFVDQRSEVTAKICDCRRGSTERGRGGGRETERTLRGYVWNRNWISLTDWQSEDWLNRLSPPPDPWPLNSPAAGERGRGQDWEEFTKWADADHTCWILMNRRTCLVNSF